MERNRPSRSWTHSRSWLCSTRSRYQSSSSSKARRIGSNAAGNSSGKWRLRCPGCNVMAHPVSEPPGVVQLNAGQMISSGRPISDECFLKTLALTDRPMLHGPCSCPGGGSDFWTRSEFYHNPFKLEPSSALLETWGLLQRSRQPGSAITQMHYCIGLACSAYSGA